MANVMYIFTKPNPTNGHDKELPYWVATTVHNSVLEYGQYASEAGVMLPPTRINICVSNWGFMRGAGATPMWEKCDITESEMPFVQGFVQYFIAQPLLVSVPIVNLVNIAIKNMDVIVGYLANNADYDCRLTSANIKEVAYHELGHASHFAQTGCDFWQVYRTRLSNEITLGNPDTRPYGNGSEANAGIVAVGEKWGNHIGYTFTNRHYGNGGANGSFANGGFTAFLQGQDWPNEPTLGLNAYQNAIENHNPNLPGDEHRWIPKGICYDLSDPAGETAPVIDNVDAYNTGLCFVALESDVRDVQKFRDRLLQQNGNLQATNVYALFSQYNY